MSKLIYIGDYQNLDKYDLKYGDIYEFEKFYSAYSRFQLYKVTQVRDGVRSYIREFQLPNVDNIYWITLAEWRDEQIDKILEDD